MKQKNAGKGTKNDHDADDKKKSRGASQTAHMKNAKATETDRHKTFHKHAAAHRRTAA